VPSVCDRPNQFLRATKNMRRCSSPDSSSILRPVTGMRSAIAVLPFLTLRPIRFQPGNVEMGSALPNYHMASIWFPSE
jgi:hypothetical protein